ncbi:MAG: NUDIX hydrolase, partial [Granulosicoccus sp.]|nr:NUDIX hydrolase [Granulosicoccus sp.]
WEFPQGSKEHEPDATPEQVAAEELFEETGLTAASTVKLGKLFQAYGYANQSVHVFLATELTQGETAPEAEEAGLVSRSFSREECDELMSDGSISDLATVAAFQLFDRYMKVHG